MRHGSANRRQRGRNNGRRSNNGGNGGNNTPNRSQVLDSNGPEVRIRGTVHQIVEKYTALAKDATSSGDNSLAENYLQHIEHYQRIINDWDAADKMRQAKRDEEKQRAEEAAAAKQAEDDLSLPASMLVEATVESTAESTVEAKQAEDA